MKEQDDRAAALHGLNGAAQDVGGDGLKVLQKREKDAGVRAEEERKR